MTDDSLPTAEGYRFSLRTMFVITFLIAWFAFLVHEAREAIARKEEAQRQLWLKTPQTPARVLPTSTGLVPMPVPAPRSGTANAGS